MHHLSVFSRISTKGIFSLKSVVPFLASRRFKFISRHHLQLSNQGPKGRRSQFHFLYFRIKGYLHKALAIRASHSNHKEEHLYF